MLDNVYEVRAQLGPRVAVRACNPVREAALAALVAAAGHEVVKAHEADLILSDRPVVSCMPVLVVSAVSGEFSGSALPEGVSSAQLSAALRAVAVGLTVRMADAAPIFDSGRPTLTPRELEILGCLSAGLSNKSVARRLGISQHTVKFHLEAVFAKLDATSRAEAVAKGLRSGLIDL